MYNAMNSISVFNLLYLTIMSKINLAPLKEILKDNQNNPKKAFDLLKTLLASTSKTAKTLIQRIKEQILRCI